MFFFLYIVDNKIVYWCVIYWLIFIECDLIVMERLFFNNEDLIVCGMI